MPNNSDKMKLVQKVGMDKHFKASSWGDYNRQMFDLLADKYDNANSLLTLGRKRRMDRRAVSKIPILENSQVLDICAGTGDISIHIAKKVESSSVVGLDASPNMISHAVNKAKGLENVSFMTGDALKLPFEDNSFDVAIISFGLRNLIDIEGGLKEMQRVVRPGGHICNIDQGKPKSNFIYACYRLYFYRLIPLLGKLLFHRKEFNTLKYLPESNDYFPRQEELVKVMQGIGLSDVKNYNYIFGAVAQQVATV